MKGNAALHVKESGVAAQANNGGCHENPAASGILGKSSSFGGKPSSFGIASCRKCDAHAYQMDHQQGVWETVAEHAVGHLAASNELVSSSGTSKLNPTQIKCLLEDCWLNTEPACVSSHSCITIKELEEWTQVGHSHTKNARCLQRRSAHHNLLEQTGLKPLANANSFLLAWLTTSPILPCEDEGDRRHVPSTRNNHLYLRDDTGAVQCKVAVCDWDWFNQALLIPCWNVIPGAGTRVPRLVEICPCCTPVVISRVTPDPTRVPHQQQTVSVTAAARMLQRHDSSKGGVNQITVTGTVVCKSPLMCIRNKPMFFFKMASDVSGSSCVSLLAKGSNLTFLYSSLPMYSSCSVSHLTPTTILKGIRKPHHIFLCRKETAVFDVQSTCGESQCRNGITGAVTKCIDATSGIYELDGKLRLYLCYQMDDTASYPVLRVGCVVTIHNAHQRLPVGKSTGPCVVCCMQSTLTVDTFSLLDTGPEKKLTPPLSGMVRLLLKYNLTLGQLEWLSSVFMQLDKKFTPTFIGRKFLHSILIRLFTTPSATSKKPLLAGRKRNIYEEFLKPSHSCLATKGTDHEQPPPWQFPVAAELFSSLKKCREQPSKSRCLLGPRDEWYSSITASTSLNPPMILLGYLHLDPATGQVQLKDQIGSVDCVITNVCWYPQSSRLTDTLTRPLTHCTPFLDTSQPTECCLPKDCLLGVAPPTERKCSLVHLPTCNHIHTWCLGHLIRVEGFLIIHEALPLSCSSTPLERSETCHSSNNREMDSLRGHREFVSFSMQSVECLNCTNGVPSGSNLANELQEKTQSKEEARTRKAPTRCNHQGENQNSSSTNSSSNTSTGQANLKAARPEDCICFSSKGSLFLLLTKSQILNATGGALLYIIQVAFLEGFPSQESGALARETDQGSPFTRPVFVRFVGDAVRWYHALHPGCVFRMKGEIVAVSKQKFLIMTSLSLNQLKAEDHDTFLTASHGATLEQIHESVLPEDIVQQLYAVQGQYRDLLHVSSVQDVAVGRTSASGNLVSFRCVILSRKKNTRYETHRDKKSKTCSEWTAQNTEDEFQFLVADTVVSSVTIEVYMSTNFLYNVLGLLPGAVVTFRQCLRSTSATGRVHCRVTPLTSVTIDALPSLVPSSLPLQDSPSVDLPTDTPVRPPDPQGSSTDPKDSSTDPAPSLSPPRRCYLSRVLTHPDSVSATETFTLRCHLQAIKSLVLKWSCQLCGHKECICSSNDELEGKMTSALRFAIEDGTGEALVWCSEPSVIATVLGLTSPQWTQLELQIKRCKEVIYSFKKPNHRDKAVVPSPTDTEGLLNLLCSHDSIQKPLVLHCRLMAWGNSVKNAPATTAGRQYAPSPHLKCLAAYEG